MAREISVGAIAHDARPRVQANSLAIAALAVLALFSARLWLHPDLLATSLGDTDDATRLVELRAFLGHGRWFDLALPAIGAPEPLVSHWSRLIDLCLAAVLAPARLILAPEAAETAMRIVWPALILLALLALVAREAMREGGLAAGPVVAGLMIMSTTAVYQFLPGRIDHHNVQILCAVGSALLLARSFALPRHGWAAGALAGLGLATGLEAMSLIAPAFAASVLIAIASGGPLRGPARAAVALAASLGAALLATTLPSRLAVAVCDAASVNLLALTALAAAGVAVADRIELSLSGTRLAMARLTVLAVAGLAGLGAYAALEPACLGGPFGQVLPELWPLWLSQVTEGQPIAFLLATSPAETLGFLLLALAGIAARTRFYLLARAGEREAGARERELFLLVVQLIALAAACSMIKMMPYAAWLSFPALARAVVGLPGIAGQSPLVTRIAAFALVGQSTLGAIAATPAARLAPRTGAEPVFARTSCSDTQSVRALATLPPGLVLGDLNLGPYVAALTPHRVVMAPYHRLGRSIVEGTRLLEGTPLAAEAGLRRLAVDYVVACRAGIASGSPAPTTLLDGLAAGIVPAYLEPVSLSGPSRLLAYRLRKAN